MRRFAPAAFFVAALAGPAFSQVPSGVPTEVGASESEAPAGDEIAVRGSGWEPGAQITLRIDGEPLAATTVEADGRFARPVMIPNDLEPGSYEVTAEGADANGDATTLTFELDVVDPMPRGTFVMVGIVAALILIVFVVTTIWFFGKRRRTSLAEAVEAGETPVRNPDPRDAPQPADRG